MERNDLYLKLAFLGGSVVMMVTTAILISCGHNGAVTNTFVGMGAAFSGANIWSLVSARKVNPPGE